MAGASTVSCGDTITSNLTLRHNLDCSGFTAAPALTIGAANVTLNLNGHKIIGPGYAASTAGVFVPYSGVRMPGPASARPYFSRE